MLRAVEELKTQTEAIYEEDISKKIDEASKNKKEFVTVQKREVPGFLISKLKKYGYKVEEDIKNNKYTIFWGFHA